MIDIFAKWSKCVISTQLNYTEKSVHKQMNIIPIYGFVTANREEARY